MKNMMAIVAKTTKGVNTFKLIPTALDCPYLEAIFDPERKILGLISKTQFQSIRMIPRIDNNGNPMRMGATDNSNFKMERVILDSFYDYEIVEKEDIAIFISRFANYDIDQAHTLLSSFYLVPNGPETDSNQQEVI